MDLSRAYSYRELDEAATRVGRALVRRGLERGDRVVLVGENSFFWLVAYLGTLRAGGIIVPVPPSIVDGDFQHVLATTEPKVGFFEAARTERHVRAFQGTTILDVAPRWAPERPTELFAELDGEGSAAFPAVAPSDVAALMFTSGSTARPRAVMITHGNLVSNSGFIVDYLSLVKEDRALVVLPFYYCYGASIFHTHFMVGASLVLDHRFMFPDKVLVRMRDTECTSFSGVPSHFQIMLRKSSLRKMTFPALRLVNCGGGKLSDVFIRELVEVIAPARVFISYGQTEGTSRLSNLAHEQLATKLGSIGKGMPGTPGVTLRVVDESGREVGPGEEGEVTAHGANISPGYWRDEAATATTFRNGLLYTGDIARSDADGFVYIVDRAKDFVKAGGVRVGSRVIEDAILEHKGVVEAVILGVPDDIMGEAVHAFVVPTDANDPDFAVELAKHCTARLPAELVPKKIVLRESLPKNDSGKVMKRVLRASIDGS